MSFRALKQADRQYRFSGMRRAALALERDRLMNVSLATLHSVRALVVAGAMVAHAAFAALPPWAYQKDQDEAPEALVIDVLSVKSDVRKYPDRTETSVEAKARVLEVKRTASGLKPGDEIAVAYTNVELKRDERRVGESTYIPVLEEGKRVPAFVKGDKESGYRPAARIYSFRELR